MIAVVSVIASPLFFAYALHARCKATAFPLKRGNKYIVSVYCSMDFVNLQFVTRVAGKMM